MYHLTTAVTVCNLIIATTYFIIPCSFIYLIHKYPMHMAIGDDDYGKERFMIRQFVLSVNLFIFTCGLTHLASFMFFFYYSTPIQNLSFVSCCMASLYTVALIFSNGKSIIDMLSRVELTHSGITRELDNVFNITLQYCVDMVSVHDFKSLTFIKVNQACRTFGYTDKMLSGISLYEIVHENDHHILQTLEHSTYNSNEEHLFTYNLKTSDKKCVYVESSCKMGSFYGRDVLFIITRNIQKRMDLLDHELTRKKEDIRIETSRDQALLLSHDIRTPLSIFELGVENIRSQRCLVDNRSVHDVLTTLTGSIKLMKFVINRIIDTSRVLSGETPCPDYTKVTIHEIIEETVMMLSEYPKSVDITIKYENVDQDLVICVDFKWIVSILTNLLINACAHTMFGGITLYIKDEFPMIRFEVHDTGIGINANDKSKLFYPFAHSNRTDTKHGLGIGLYNCAWKTRFLNGTYHVEDNPVSQGSVFIIRIPKIFSPVKQSDDIVNSSETILNPDIKILIIDDTISFRRLFKRNLEKQGVAKVDEAENGEMGLLMLRKERYHVVFVDYYMPLKNGCDCISDYRVYENEAGLKPRSVCVLISADKLTLTENIFDFIILKPLDMKEVISIIQKTST